MAIKRNFNYLRLDKTFFRTNLLIIFDVDTYLKLNQNDGLEESNI